MVLFLSSATRRKVKSTIINQKQYHPSAQQFFNRNLCSVFAFLCLDLSMVVYNSWGRFLISTTGINGLLRISGLCQSERRMRSSVPFSCKEIVCINRLIQFLIFFFNYQSYKSSAFWPYE